MSPLAPVVPRRLASALRLLVTFFAFLLGTACGPTAYEECVEEEALGIFVHDKNAACGCELTNCAALNKVCFEGDCCDPGLEPERCGCPGGCGDHEVCFANACCDPATARSDDNCGCEGSCDAGRGERCQEAAPGIHMCIVDPLLLAYDDANCGGNGPCKSADHCVQGACVCDPTDGDNLRNVEDCGCRGPCPAGASCLNGQCSCDDPTKVTCDVGGGQLECIDSHACSCDPLQHENDDLDCACAGACSALDSCVEGTCLCDINANLSNEDACGCGAACPFETVNGTPTSQRSLACSGGSCTCPPGKQLCEPDPLSMMAPGSGILRYDDRCVTSAPGVEYCGDCNTFCTGGSTCHRVTNAAGQVMRYECDYCNPSEHQSDELDCGCEGPCGSGEYCNSGACVCDPSQHLFDELNCGCEGTCELGESCSYGNCVCDPLQHLNDSTNCACDGACPSTQAEFRSGTTIHYASHLSCSSGHCACPPGEARCNPLGFDDLDASFTDRVIHNRCVPSSELPRWAPDCHHVCSSFGFEAIAVDGNNDDDYDCYYCCPAGDLDCMRTARNSGCP
jgi:hypothetical protein